MLIHNAVITGSLTLNGTDIGDITGSEAAINALNIFSSSIYAYTASNDTTNTTQNNRLSSLEITSGSLLTASSSFSTRVTNTETTASSLVNASSSFSTRVTNNETTGSNLVAASASFSTRTTNAESSITSLQTVTGSYATTSSNIFVGAQYISNITNAISFTSTGSLYTDGGMRISKDMYVSGTAYFNNVTVFGTQSISYISSSQLNIGDNLISVNTDTPLVRFGGLAVYDSGSTGLTGSMLWDSENNKWVYSNPSGSTYDGGMLISGPRNSSGLGNEQGTTACMLMVGQGGDHITSSAIYHSSTVTCIPNTLAGGVGCFSGAVCSPAFVGGTVSGTTGTFTSTVIAGNGSTQTEMRINSSGGNNEGPFLRFQKGGANTAYIGAYSSIINGTSNDLTYYAVCSQQWMTNNNTATKMLLDGSGNLGLGVTPSAWTTNFGVKAIDVGSKSTFYGSDNDANVSFNQFFDGTNPIYKTTGAAGRFTVVGNEYKWLQAPSGTAGCTITFTQAMTLDACGRLGIGCTAPPAELTVADVNIDPTTNVYNAYFLTTTPQSPGRGATLGLGGETGGGPVAFALLQGAKENINFADTAGYLSLRTRPNGGGLCERLRITSAGSVGIGTTTPCNLLHLQTSSTTPLLVQSSGTAGSIQLRNTGGTTSDWIIQSDGGAVACQAAFRIYDVTAAAYRMSINSCGNVGIGTTTPCSALEIFSRAADVDRTVPHNVLTITAEQGNAPYGFFGGSILFRNRSYVSGLVNSSRIRSVIYDDGAPANCGGGLWFESTSTPGGTLTPALAISYAGRVGVGCTLPTYHLEVRCAASTSCCYLAAMFSRSTGANDGVGDIVALGANGVSSIAGIYRVAGSWGLEFQTANQNTRMRIDNSGNVGINTLTPNARLEVYPGTISNDACQEIIRLDIPGANIFSAATGYINFRGYDISNNVQRDVAWIGAELVPNLDASCRFGGNLVFRTTSSGLSQTPQERMRITSTGITCFACTVCAPNFFTAASGTVSACRFYTATQDVAVNNGVFTNIFCSYGNGGVWLVSFTLNGNPGQIGYAIVGNAFGSAITLLAGATGSQTCITTSGLNLQVCQTSGANLTARVSSILLTGIIA